MKPLFSFCFILVCMMLAVTNAEAKLRGLGELRSGGTFDKDPDHIILFLDGEWEILESMNAGTDWKLIKKEDVPKDLGPLQQKGVFPEYHLFNDTLIRISSDGKWQDISPWSFLRKTLREDVNSRRDAYHKEFNFRIPSDDYWYIYSLASFAILTFIISFYLFKAGVKWFLPMCQTLVLGGIFTGAIAMVYEMISSELLYKQWTYYHSLYIAYPKWTLGITFHLIGNPYLAPVTAIFLFPLTPLFCESRKLLKTPGSIWAYRIAALLPYCFIIFAVYSFIFGRTFDW